MIGLITQWSYSRWDVYEKCPRQAMYKFVEKRKDPNVGPAMVRGREIDEKATKYLRGEIKTLPTELKLLRDEFKTLRKKKATAQLEWAFTRSWDPCGWFAHDCWARVKTDYWIAGKEVAAKPFNTWENSQVIDLKTGRLKEYEEQMELYGLAGLLMAPAPVDVGLYFSDHGKVVVPQHGTYHQSEVRALKKTWEKRTKKMLSDTVFKPTPGAECRFCPFSKSKGGPCEHG